MNQKDKPYGRFIKKRYLSGDENIFWKKRKSKAYLCILSQ